MTMEVEAKELAAEIERRLRAMLDRNPTPDEMFGADGRALGHVAPREPCSWCRADRYDRASGGRCPQCNEPWYDGVLAWPGPTTATLTPCALRFGGGGSRDPSGHLSVARRMALHRGAWAGREWAGHDRHVRLTGRPARETRNT